MENFVLNRRNQIKNEFFSFRTLKDVLFFFQLKEILLKNAINFH